MAVWTGFIQAVRATFPSSPDQRVVRASRGEDQDPLGLYVQLGFVLLMTGSSLVVVSMFFLDSVPLIALGTATVILSIICFGLERSIPRVSVAMGILLMEAGQHNIAALAEELGATQRALYLPSSMTTCGARALLPLGPAPDFSQPRFLAQDRLITHYGASGQDVGILVITPGSIVVQRLESRPGQEPQQLEMALSELLAGELHAARGVIVSVSLDQLLVRLTGAITGTRLFASDQLLGSPVASVIASVAAETLGRPITIDRETMNGSDVLLELTAH